MKNELQTDSLLDAAFQKRKRVFVPKIAADSMKMIEITRGELESMEVNSYGIKEPQDGPDGEVDLVIVPGVAFDKERNRLGHGKGYYDRWIQRQKRRPTLLALSLKEQIIESVPTAETDQQVDAIITDTMAVDVV